MEHTFNAGGTRFLHLLGNLLKVKDGKYIASYHNNMVDNNFTIAHNCMSSFVMIMMCIVRQVNWIMLARAGTNPFNPPNAVAELVPHFYKEYSMGV